MDQDKNLSSENDGNDSFKMQAANERKRAFPDWFLRTRNSIYYMLGVIEVLLAFRLIFKMLGANTRNGLVVVLYSLTNVLVAPFSSIFKIFAARSPAAQFVFEPATLVAMIVYAVIARGIIGLVKLSFSENI